MRAPGVFFLSLAMCLAGASTAPVEAHGGGLNSEGCHNNRKTGDYHCHRGGSSPPKRAGAQPFDLSATGAYANCTAARAAGAAPVYRGIPDRGTPRPGQRRGGMRMILRILQTLLLLAIVYVALKPVLVGAEVLPRGADLQLHSRRRLGRRWSCLVPGRAQGQDRWCGGSRNRRNVQNQSAVPVSRGDRCSRSTCSAIWGRSRDKI